MSLVLLVEDEPLLREMTRQDLADLGLAVACARNGDEAWEMLQANADIATLITDIRMPGQFDGWQLAARARDLRPKLRVIYITGFSPDEVSPVPGGVLVKKPYRLAEIERALREVGESLPPN